MTGKELAAACGFCVSPAAKMARATEEVGVQVEPHLVQWREASAGSWMADMVAEIVCPPGWSPETGSTPGHTAWEWVSGRDLQDRLRRDSSTVGWPSRGADMASLVTDIEEGRSGGGREPRGTGAVRGVVVATTRVEDGVRYYLVGRHHEVPGYEFVGATAEGHAVAPVISHYEAPYGEEQP